MTSAPVPARFQRRRLLIVTRPLAQAVPWVHDLQALGQQAQALPLIAIAPVAEGTEVRATWARLHEFALVMFVSANAVAQFFAWRPAGSRWPADLRAGSTGPGTTAALRAAQLPAGAVVQPPADAATFDTEALWARLRDEPWTGRRVLVVRGEEGRDWLAETMRAHGADVEFIAAYERRVPLWDAAQRAVLEEALRLPHAHLWLFSSSQAVAHLRQLAPQADWQAAAALASHPRIAQAARGVGFGAVVEAGPSVAAIAEAAEQWPPIESDTP